MNRLTRQEQLLIIAVLALLLTGLCVKYYRTAHPSAQPVVAVAKP